MPLVNRATTEWGRKKIARTISLQAGRERKLPYRVYYTTKGRSDYTFFDDRVARRWAAQFSDVTRVERAPKPGEKHGCVIYRNPQVKQTKAGQETELPQ